MRGLRTFAVSLLAASIAINTWFLLKFSSATLGNCPPQLNQTLLLDAPLPKTKSARPGKLADGCYHVFIDAVFSSVYGPEQLRDARDFCIFAFEPNPSHMKRQLELKKAYLEMGWRYHFIPAGLSDKKTRLTFYKVGDQLGYSAVPKAECQMDRSKCPPRHIVPSYRLSDWIEEEVSGRILPPQAFGGKGYVTGPRVSIKLDVEMLEWLVIPDLFSSGVLCREVDALMGEFHQQWHLYPVTFENINKDGSNWTLHNATEAEGLAKAMIGMVNRNAHCKTRLDMRDDESYISDGFPLPGEAGHGA
ncbi:hypothetical protein THAOC_03017 [Thalassiosira oceanica]|uniref:Uncharacterized protein n=1 Tax=Thalassiosira oceanica TaxID=159749 RepID=K0TLG0_THAOC|nr:hypothetical protein THAOC_03017 [Thalassiosira oceanica]|eukprot:EJK75266.1 hypothetical protein THAOC_03017 [Thalassiosira oceanica]